MTQGQHSLWSLDPHVPSAPLPLTPSQQESAAASAAGGSGGETSSLERLRHCGASGRAGHSAQTQLGS